MAASLWVISLTCFLSAVTGITMLYYQPHHGLDESGKHLRMETYAWVSAGTVIQAVVIGVLTRCFDWKNRFRRILGSLGILTLADGIMLGLVFVFVRYIA